MASLIRQARRWLAYRYRPQCTGQADCRRYDHWTDGPHMGFSYDSWRDYPLRDESRDPPGLWGLRRNGWSDG